MRYFARALQQAWRHWLALILALLCSLGVAALWGANIAAIFPIIETTLHGDSLLTWNNKRLERAEKSFTDHQAEIQKVEASQAAAKDPTAKRDLELQLNVLQTQLKLDRANIYSAQRLQPFFARFLPSKPFPTVVLIASLVAVATAIKQFLMLSNTMLVSYVSQSIARDIRGQIFDKALSLDRPAFDARESAALRPTSRIRPTCWRTASRISTAGP